MNQVLQEIGREADQSIVTVSSVKHQVDWFDNPVESTGQYAGIILSISRGEIMDPDGYCGSGGGRLPACGF